MKLGKRVKDSDTDFFDALFQAGDDLAALGGEPPITDEANERLATPHDVQ